MSDEIVASEPTEIILETPPAETPAEEPKEATAAAENEEQPEEKPEKTFTQKELDEIIRKRISKESRRIEKQTRLEIENEQLRSQLQPKPKEQEIDRKDYDSDDAYIKAYIANEVSKGVSQELAKNSETNTTSKAAENWAAKEEKARESLEDFDEVMSGLQGTKLFESAAIGDALNDSDIGAEIAYYLANNPKERAHIESLSPSLAVKEIVKLEIKLSPSPAKPSNAPEPAKPIQGGKTLTKKLEDMSYEEMLAHDKKRGARYLR